MIDPLPEIEGHPAPGGCGQCRAMQELTPSVIYEDVFYLRICHAVGCPFLARVRASRWN
jgi:hypothetical protein